METFKGDCQPELKENLKNCRFCTLDRSQPNHFTDRGLPRLDLDKLVVTPNFFVLPDYLPVHPKGYHLILIPSEHVYGFAQLDDKRGEESQEIILDLERRLGESLAIIEHGGTKHGGKNQSVYHAHSHLIGSGGQNVLGYMSHILQREGIDFEVASVNGNLVRNVKDLYKGFGYLYVQHDGNAIVAHDRQDKFPSQFAQKNMGLLHTGEPTDWKAVSRDPRLADLSVKRILAVRGKLIK